MHPERPMLSKSASDSNLATTDTVGEQVNGDEALSDGSEPNLNKEVAALSNKLISAINHQTKLDDSLSATKHELELSKARIRQLEAVAQEHADMMAKGLLVEKKEVESETRKLLKRLQEESIQRGKAEKDKRTIEQELENLTTALFDEANKMVSAARKERDAMDRKNDLLKSQLKDTESLLASHQEQLAELKAVMQQMTADREENDGGVSTGTPPTPALGNRASKDSMARAFDALHLAPNSATNDDMPPCPPTSLINLLHPILRHDIAAYRDFCEVLRAPKLATKTSPLGRLSSGSFTGMQVMGMGIGISPSPNHSPNSSINFFGSRKDTEAPSAVSSAGSINANNSQLIAQGLRETKFYKRALVEDIEPTLRLDNAPGLSWLARRNVLSAITEGSLLIDPMPSSPRVSIFSCALCGETRADEQHARAHRMRTNDTQNAQRYPVCGYCVNRLRSVCDFLAFLRTLKEGLWKCENEGDEKHAWEESVKLRERMFWSRIGGGVVPAFLYKESPRSSLEKLNDAEQEGVGSPRTPQSKAITESVKLDIPKKRQSRQDMPVPEMQIRDITPGANTIATEMLSPVNVRSSISSDGESGKFIFSEDTETQSQFEDVVANALDGGKLSLRSQQPQDTVDRELVDEKEEVKTGILLSLPTPDAVESIGTATTSEKPRSEDEIKPQDESELEFESRPEEQPNTEDELRTGHDTKIEADIKTEDDAPAVDEKMAMPIETSVERAITPVPSVPGGW